MKATDIFNQPSFLRGMSRVADLYGKLDEYKYTTDPDSELLSRDWGNVGQDLQNEITRYGQRSSCQSC